MRVLVISNLYPSRKHPSFGVFVRNFLQDLERNGAIVLLCTIKGKSGRGVLCACIVFSFFQVIRYYIRPLCCTSSFTDCLGKKVFKETIGGELSRGGFGI
jgi:hypothetical protein